MKYNKSVIMKRAWVIFRNNDENLTFGDSLRQSWNIAKNGVSKLKFNTIYAENYRKILGYVMSQINGKIEDAEEITQDVFIKVAEHLAKYDVYKAKVNTWIYTIAKNKIIDYYRKNKSGIVVNVDGYVNDEGESTFQFEDNVHTDNNIVDEDNLSAVERALSKLNVKEKEIATMFFIKEMKYTEIANVLDIPMGTVKGLLSRIRGKLQKELTKVYASL